MNDQEDNQTPQASTSFVEANETVEELLQKLEKAQGELLLLEECYELSGEEVLAHADEFLQTNTDYLDRLESWEN